VSRRLVLTSLDGMPEVRAGDDLAALIGASLDRSGIAVVSGDVLVVAQKVVSKSEGRRVALADVSPSARALELAAVTGKDPRLVELVLSESTEVLRAKKDVMIVEHRLGCVVANAGIDQSNVDQEEASALLLPLDPDASCERLRRALGARHDVDIGVVVNDSFGRAWRNGTIGTAIGVAGLPGLLDLRGRPDRFARKLMITQVGLADELGAAASLLMGQADEGCPVVHVRGVPYARREGSARELVRPKREDLFR
jgi:coenzyme F420-0:L-glutamate ligase/coenzyme F420-1:gamma-L-glutamate ligase